MRQIGLPPVNDDASTVDLDSIGQGAGYLTTWRAARRGSRRVVLRHVLHESAGTVSHDLAHLTEKALDIRSSHGRQALRRRIGGTGVAPCIGGAGRWMETERNDRAPGPEYFHLARPCSPDRFERPIEQRAPWCP